MFLSRGRTPPQRSVNNFSGVREPLRAIQPGKFLQIISTSFPNFYNLFKRQ